MEIWKQHLMTHMAGEWGWCYVVYKEGKIRWNVVSHVSEAGCCIVW